MTVEGMSGRSTPLTRPRTNARTLRAPAKFASAERLMTLFVPWPAEHGPFVNDVVIDDCMHTESSSPVLAGHVSEPEARPPDLPTFSMVALSVQSAGFTALTVPPPPAPPVAPSPPPVLLPGSPPHFVCWGVGLAQVASMGGGSDVGPA